MEKILDRPLCQEHPGRTLGSAFVTSQPGIYRMATLVEFESMYPNIAISRCHPQLREFFVRLKVVRLQYKRDGDIESAQKTKIIINHALPILNISYAPGLLDLTVMTARNLMQTIYNDIGAIWADTDSIAFPEEVEGVTQGVLQILSVQNLEIPFSSRIVDIVVPPRNTKQAKISEIA